MDATSLEQRVIRAPQCLRCKGTGGDPEGPRDDDDLPDRCRCCHELGPKDKPCAFQCAALRAMCDNCGGCGLDPNRDRARPNLGDVVPATCWKCGGCGAVLRVVVPNEQELKANHR